MEIGVGWGLQEQQLGWPCDRGGFRWGNRRAMGFSGEGGGGRGEERGEEAGSVSTLCSPCVLQALRVLWNGVCVWHVQPHEAKK